MANVIVLPRADSDFEDAVRWLESCSPRSARQFEINVAAAIAFIARMPEIYALVDDRHRVCPIKKSQYLLVYRYDSAADLVTVVAAPHAMQQPRSWP